MIEKPLKVLHFYKKYFPDYMVGLDQVIDHIASGSVKLGVEVDVLTLTKNKDPKTIEINGYLVHQVHMSFQIASTGFSFPAFWRFRQLAKQADIIHFHYPWPFMDLVYFATCVCKPTVVTYHSDIIRQVFLNKIYQPLKNKFLGSMSSIVATSPNYLATSNDLAKYKSNVKVIPIGIDKDNYPDVSTKKMDLWRKKVGSKYFLFVGVFRYYKGLHILLEAAQAIDYPIVIVGAGPIEQTLKAQAIQLRLRNIHFVGFQSDEDKVALLKSCYGVVFPSHLRSEAFGISLLEGAMFGKPLISSEIGTGTSFINIAYETGLVIPPSNPEALRQAMIYLWENPEQAAEMGRRAEQRYWQLFSAEKMVRSYVDLYQELQSNNG